MWIKKIHFFPILFFSSPLNTSKSIILSQKSINPQFFHHFNFFKYAKEWRIKQQMFKGKESTANVFHVSTISRLNNPKKKKKLTFATSILEDQVAIFLLSRHFPEKIRRGVDEELETLISHSLTRRRWVRSVMEPPSQIVSLRTTTTDPDHVKVIQWDDFQHDLARLASLSSALHEANEKKRNLQHKLESLIQVGF